MHPLLAILALAVAAPAQPTADSKPGIVLNVSEVHVTLTVTDRKGHFISDLTKNQFVVLEDKRPQTILSILPPAETPLRLAIVLDSSNSVREQFRSLQNAAADLVKNVARPGVDNIHLVSFDIQVEDVAQSNDPARLAQAIREIRPGGGTRLYDAIYESSRDKLTQGDNARHFRKGIIVISDGEDTQSFQTRDQALEMAHKNGIVIYAVSTETGTTETHGDRVLKYLAQETGGLAFFPFKSDDPGKSFRQLGEELRNQYSVIYRPDPMRTDGKYHSISVNVRGRKDLTVKSRKGYYAPRS